MGVSSGCLNACKRAGIGLLAVFQRAGELLQLGLQLVLPLLQRAGDFWQAQLGLLLLKLLQPGADLQEATNVQVQGSSVAGATGQPRYSRAAIKAQLSHAGNVAVWQIATNTYST